MVTHKITLDVAKDGIQANVIMVKGESSSREIAISLRNGKNTLELGARMVAVLRAKKPSGADLLNSCQVYTANSVYPNTVIYNVTDGTVDEAGSFTARIMIWNAEGELLWSPEFSITVKENGQYDVDDEIVQHNEYTALISATEAANAAAAATKEISAKVGDLGEMEIDAETIVKAINFLEVARKANIDAVGDVNELETAAKVLVDAINEVNAGAVKSTELSEQAKPLTVPRRGDDGTVKVGTPKVSSDATSKGYVDENFVAKAGNSIIDGTLSVKSLVVEESTSLAEVETLKVKEAVIVANSDGIQLAGIYGYVIRVDADKAYGLVYEPSSDTLKLGLGVYNAETGEFAFDDGQGQAIATRGNIADGRIPVWSEERKRFEDSGKSVFDFAPKDSAQVVSNALKGNASGTAVLMDDVSPVRHELGVRVSSENLAANVWGSHGYNTILENGIVTQIEADTYEIAYLKAQVYQDTTFLSGADVLSMTSIGIHSISFTKPTAGNMLVFGINGRERDTTIRIDITDLPEGVYTVSANFTNLTQGSISWCDTMLNKGTIVTPYKPHVSDLSAVKLTAQGKNLLNIDAGLNLNYGDGDILTKENDIYTFNNRNGVRYFDIPCDIPKGVDVNFSFEAIENATTGDFSYAILYLALIGDSDTDAFTLETSRQSEHIKTSYKVNSLFLSLMSTTSSGEYIRFKTPQLEIGTAATEYEPYKSPVEYTVNADGTVDGLKSIAPSTTLTSDTEGVLIECEYNKDANAVVAKLEDRLAALEAAVISQ